MLLEASLDPLHSAFKLHEKLGHGLRQCLESLVSSAQSRSVSVSVRVDTRGTSASSRSPTEKDLKRKEKCQLEVKEKNEEKEKTPFFFLPVSSRGARREVWFHRYDRVVT